MKKHNNELSPDKEICFNCKHYKHMIAIGLGVRCGHPDKQTEGELAPLLPSRSHTCPLFEWRKARDIDS